MPSHIQWMGVDDHSPVIELYTKKRSQGLRPKIIVDYERIPYVHGSGNVRVTVDYNIRYAFVYPCTVADEDTCISTQALDSLCHPDGDGLQGVRCTDFLNPDCPTFPAGVDWDIILEIKWDDYLPTVIRHAVHLNVSNEAPAAYTADLYHF